MRRGPGRVGRRRAKMPSPIAERWRAAASAGADRHGRDGAARVPGGMSIRWKRTQTQMPNEAVSLPPQFGAAPGFAFHAAWGRW